MHHRVCIKIDVLIHEDGWALEDECTWSMCVRVFGLCVDICSQEQMYLGLPA